MGLNPNTGRDPAQELLEQEAARAAAARLAEQQAADDPGA